MPNTIFEDLLKWSKTIDITGDTDPKNKRIFRELEARCNCPYDPDDSLEGVIEVSKMTVGDANGGTFELRPRQSQPQFPSSQPLVITDTVDWNATAEEMQAVLDNSNGAITSWLDYQPGDIVVTGGPAGAGGADTFFTYSGDSVHGFHITLAAGQASLTKDAGPVGSNMVLSEHVKGQHAQFWFAALKAMGVITGTDPLFSDAPAGQYTVHPRGETENYPSQETIKTLVKEASVQENEDWMTELLVPLGIQF